MTLSAIVPDMSDVEYHKHPALSSTGARLLLDSPARFHAAQFAPQVVKAEFDLGHAVHEQVLEVGPPMVEIPDELLASNGAISTTKAKEFVADARRDGMLPLKAPTYRAIKQVRDAVMANKTARALFEQDGNRECSVFATDPETGVELRARFDILAALPGDLKSTGKPGGASPSQFAKSVANIGYDVQEEHYLDVYQMHSGERLDFVFVVVELEPPYLVGTYQLDKDFRTMGAAKAKRARQLFAECTRDRIWPGYPDEVQLISPPRWASIEYQEVYA